MAAGGGAAGRRPGSWTRAGDTSAPGRALAPHTIPLANCKSVLLCPARGATEPTKCPLCADKYYTSGAMLEHLAWHAVHAAAPVEDKEAASHILQGMARRSSCHAPYAHTPPPQAAGHAAALGDEEEAAEAAPEPAV